MVRGKIIALAVGLLLFGIGLRLWLGCGPAPRGARTSPSSPALLTRAVSAVRQDPSGMPVPSGRVSSYRRDELEAVGRGPWGRNPFLTPAEEAALLRGAGFQEVPVGFAPRVVQAILVSAERRIAMIDGHVVAEGDLIGEERVVEIRPRAVVLGRGSRIRTVEMQVPGIPVRSRTAPAAPGESHEGGKTSR
jgi:hypothetical protein